MDPIASWRDDEPMADVSITVDVLGSKVALAKMKDPRVRSALTKMGEDIARALASAKCPIHQASPTKIRIHVGKSGDADLAYESCCEKLRDVVTKSLGP